MEGAQYAGWAAGLEEGRISPAPARVAPGDRAARQLSDARLDPKLVAAAHQFEASLMAELLKPLSSGDIFAADEAEAGAGRGGGLSDLTSEADGSGGALMSFGAEALARALSEKGGLGIARQVLDHFAAQPERPSRLPKRPDAGAVQPGKPEERGAGDAVWNRDHY